MTFADRFMGSVVDRKVVKNRHRMALPDLSSNASEIATRGLYHSIEIPVYRHCVINLPLFISNINVLYLPMHIDVVTS